jgi:uncharacterized membrane protein YgcG
MRGAWWALLLALLAPLAAADERILSFESAVHIRPDSTLEVVETLRVRSEARQIRRGITREFPTEYRDRHGRRVVVGFDVLGVQRDGKPEPFKVEKRANGVRIWIGDPDVYLPAGNYSYQIVYRTDRQVGFFEDHDELYWNVTGNGWVFPIDYATARVTLPAPVPADQVSLEAYTGRAGAKGRDWEAHVDTDAAVFATTRQLAPYEGLTIVVGWPKGLVTAPDGWQRVGYTLRDAWPAFLAVGGLVLLLLYYQRAWAAVGRDPAKGVTVPLYESPGGLSPASLRYLSRMRYDDRCFAAAVLQLAVKGWLTIEQAPRGLLGGGGEYTLSRRDPPGGDPLSADELALFDSLFTGRSAVELDNENHSVLTAAKDAHLKVLKQTHVPVQFRLNTGWHTAGIVSSLLLGVLAIGLPLLTGDFGPGWLFGSPPGWVTLGAVLAAFAADVVFGWLLKAPTVAGRKLMDQIEGFRLYLDLAEGNDLKLVDEPPLTPALYERNLPAALALGVEQNWAERFATVFATQAAAQAPSWYHGDSWDAGNVSGFSSSFGSSFSSAISSASTPPGSSSGGGGGGSSGGGGGGGGGGGW